LEDGAETAEKENMSQLAARQLKYITNLENALVRIKKQNLRHLFSYRKVDLQREIDCGASYYTVDRGEDDEARLIGIFKIERITGLNRISIGLFTKSY